MISLAGYKWASALFIFLASALLPAVFLKKRDSFKHGEPMTLGEAFAAGIFLGAAFFHLLPDAIHSFHAHSPDVSYPVPEAVCVGGILLFFVLERLARLYDESTVKKMLPSFVIAILVIHALTEGAALGIGNSFSEVIMLAIAIVAHKGSEGFALAMVLLRHRWQLKHVLRFSVFFAAMTPLGILLGANLSIFNFVQSELLESLFSAFAAGTFIYIATLHHLHGHSHGETENTKRLFFVALGVIIMGLLALWT